MIVIGAVVALVELVASVILVMIITVIIGRWGLIVRTVTIMIVT